MRFTTKIIIHILITSTAIGINAFGQNRPNPESAPVIELPEPEPEPEVVIVEVPEEVVIIEEIIDEAPAETVEPEEVIDIISGGNQPIRLGSSRKQPAKWSFQ